jgi:hypothetical protein
VEGEVLMAQTTIQILRCLTLGRYTARVVQGELEIAGPQPLAGPLPDSIRKRRDELVAFLTEHCGGTWPPKVGSNLGGALAGTRIHIPTWRKAGLLTYDHKGWPPGVAYIGRSYTRAGYDLPDTPWMNEHRFDKKDDAARARALALYREDILRDVGLLSRLGELDGKILACWCTPDELCHGDVLLELLRARTIEDDAAWREVS